MTTSIEPRAVAAAPTTSLAPVLTDEMLQRFAERAPQYDRENRFFTEDFEELRASSGDAATPSPTSAASSAGSATTRRRPRSR